MFRDSFCTPYLAKTASDGRAEPNLNFYMNQVDA